MDILLRRTLSTDVYTIGEMTINGTHLCYTLEDAVRTGPKVYGKTAIPAGKYEVAISYSNRFKRPMPLLLRVPFYEGIRIHPGCTADDTEGCILVGTAFTTHGVLLKSRDAYGRVFKFIAATLNKEKVYLDIQNMFPTEAV